MTKWNDFHWCFFCAYSATSSWKPPISLFLPVLSFCPPEPWFYLQVTFYRKVFPCYCLEMVYFLSQGYLHFNGATYPCVRIAIAGKVLEQQGVKVAAYHQAHNVLQKYSGTRDSRNVPCLTRQGKRTSNLWSPSDVYWEPWRSLYEPDHGIISHCC